MYVLASEWTSVRFLQIEDRLLLSLVSVFFEVYVFTFFRIKFYVHQLLTVKKCIAMWLRVICNSNRRERYA
jgi:hypothetical protein